MATFSTHPSIRLKGTEDTYEPVLCSIPDCPKRLPHLHCPFCVKTEVFHDPVILKAHYRVKHVDKGIDFSGLKVLRCCDNCEIVGMIKGQKAFKGAHWHCYKCKNGFNRRDEAMKHYKTHFRNPMTTFQIRVQQDINQMMYVPMHTEVVECPTNIGTMSNDGSIYIPPWATDQLVTQGNDNYIQQPNNNQLYTNYVPEPLHQQAGIAANETIGNGNDDGHSYYVMERGQGDYTTQCTETITTAMKTKTTEQWVHELESAAAQEQNNVNHAYNILGDQLTNQVSDEEVLSLRQEVKQLKTEVCAKDEHIAQLQLREKELMSQLRTLDGLPVSEILGDLKDKQEQLFLQYISKLKPSDSTSAAASSSEASALQQAGAKLSGLTPILSPIDSQFSQSSRTLSNASCQSEEQLPPLDALVDQSQRHDAESLLARSEAILSEAFGAMPTTGTGLIDSLSRLPPISTLTSKSNPFPLTTTRVSVSSSQELQLNSQQQIHNDTESEEPIYSLANTASASICSPSTARLFEIKNSPSIMTTLKSSISTPSPRTKRVRIIYASPSQKMARNVVMNVVSPSELNAGAKSFTLPIKLVSGEKIILPTSLNSITKSSDIVYLSTGCDGVLTETGVSGSALHGDVDRIVDTGVEQISSFKLADTSSDNSEQLLSDSLRSGDNNCVVETPDSAPGCALVGAGVNVSRAYSENDSDFSMCVNTSVQQSVLDMSDDAALASGKEDTCEFQLQNSPEKSQPSELSQCVQSLLNNGGDFQPSLQTEADANSCLENSQNLSDTTRADVDDVDQTCQSPPPAFEVLDMSVGSVESLPKTPTRFSSVVNRSKRKASSSPSPRRLVTRSAEKKRLRKS